MITAKQIAEWAATADAQRTLPKLVRRLVNLTATTTQLAMPSGESTSDPGWDGEVHSPTGNAWVPAGLSCWEASCESGVTSKANKDFKKRTEAYPAAYRATRTYTFVTPRKWRGKAAWVGSKRSQGDWLDVRAYDADDLEQWLENSSAVALAFAEEIGLTGPGVESLNAYLQQWLVQTRPTLTAQALLTGRADQSAQLIERILKASPQAAPTPISLKADSVEEATAFVTATIAEREELADAAVVVTSRDGWRFVDKNVEIKIAIASSPQVAERPTARDGLTVIVPYASGDMTKLFEGVAGRLDEEGFHLDRPDHEEFENALQQISVEENDARRMSLQCGRSWSVFRRQHATNPAIRRPAWLDHQASSALSAVCLLGAWSNGKDADKAIVERVSGVPYDELEKHLLELERLDDSPILRIGEVWKAKSALELLALFGDRITDNEFDRFFAASETLLSASDPQLELPDEERYAAAIHGKVRPESGLLIKAVCDTLIKLAVRGPDIPALAARDIHLRVDRVIRNLLRDADEIRWLSLSSLLPALAEASPDEFLTSVEASLDSPSAPVRRLLSESKTGFSGSCWHAGLLWALETLAWAPQRLTRVSIILARLSETEIGGNWGNNPDTSLLDLYRSWLPQTSASIAQRIAALDVLIKRVPEPAYRLLDHLVNVGQDMASPSSRPKWRDDDAGSGRGVTHKERHQMVMAALERQIDMSAGHPQRVAALVKKLAHLAEEHAQRVLSLLPEFESAENTDKEIIRSALRHKIHWHRNYDERPNDEIDTFLKPLEEAYEKLAPDDLLVRHAWLIRDGWPDAPFRTRDEDFQGKQDTIEAMRNSALAEIFSSLGWYGLVELAEREGSGWRVGFGVPKLELPLPEIARWIADSAGDLTLDNQLTSMVGGILSSLQPEHREAVLDLIISSADEAGRSLEWKVRLLVLCRDGPVIWRRVEQWGEEAENLYWQSCLANIWSDEGPEDFRFALRKLVDARRAVSALNACHGKFKELEPEFVAEMLEGVTASASAELSRMDGYSIKQAMRSLEKSGAIDYQRLARIEFSLFPVFGYDGEGQAETLYYALMTEPSTFLELLCLVYRPANAEAPTAVDESTKGTIETAWRVLRACKRQPGTGKDGSIDPDAFASFIAEAQRQADEKNRRVVCDLVLGEILAYGPDGADGVWPFEPARDALESSSGDEMLRGFNSGCFNKRGVHSRGVFDGGEQERDLAAYYRQHATALEISYPRVAGMLSRVAESYDRHGLMEDLEVRLRREGH